MRGLQHLRHAITPPSPSQGGALRDIRNKRDCAENYINYAISYYSLKHKPISSSSWWEVEACYPLHIYKEGKKINSSYVSCWNQHNEMDYRGKKAECEGKDKERKIHVHILAF